ncbi:MAG: adenylate/guanylate cyclase domain-containing protein [Kiritimatiellae bacterium]|nr:adenylate/guanylate cyclase domain-containing protein [Kiritimatiellia bacterium]
MSFRRRLVCFGLLLIAILAVPVVCLEIQRPWQRLYSLLGRTEAHLLGMRSALDEGSLGRLSKFALDVTAKLHGRDWTQRNETIGAAFNMLLDENRLLPEEDVTKLFEQENVQIEGYTYEALSRWYEFWRNELKDEPRLLALLRRYRRILRDSAESALASGFPVSDVYIMLDLGRREDGYFRDNIAFVLESLGWWESAYPGEFFSLVETRNLDWRQSYDAQLGGRLGFAHNRVMVPKRFFLPDFKTDEWGTWFTGWLTTQVEVAGHDKVYCVLTVDFDAGEVKRLMWGVGIKLLGVALLLAVILALTTRYLARSLARPIDALVEGANAVMAGRYDDRVPSTGRDEFAHLIDVFNRMMQWVKEKANLKDTLTKLLSEELAERAAGEGLVLGGQQVDCTIMFTDFAGFSTITQKMTAEQVVEMLNLYFAELIPVVKRHGGFPDKYIGDAIVVIFGAPVRVDDHAGRAVRCAVDLQRKLREINDRRRAEGKPVFEMRIGLNSGEVVAGAIGCDLKLEYTSIGEATNLANRMESKCRIGHVLVSENTYKRVKLEQFADVRIGATPEKEYVKGYRDPVLAYDVTVHELRISKDPTADDPARFYVYEKVARS